MKFERTGLKGGPLPFLQQLLPIMESTGFKPSVKAQVDLLESISRACMETPSYAWVASILPPKTDKPRTIGDGFRCARCQWKNSEYYQDTDCCPALELAIEESDKTGNTEGCQAMLIEFINIEGSERSYIHIGYPGCPKEEES